MMERKSTLLKTCVRDDACLISSRHTSHENKGFNEVNQLPRSYNILVKNIFHAADVLMTTGTENHDAVNIHTMRRDPVGLGSTNEVNGALRNIVGDNPTQHILSQNEKHRRKWISLTNATVAAEKTMKLPVETNGQTGRADNGHNPVVEN